MHGLPSKDVFTANGNIADLDEAMEIIKELWDKVHPDCVFSDQEPDTTPEKANLPHIIYRLVHRTHSAQFSDGKKPRILKVYPDPDQEGHNITEATEMFDVKTDIIIYANSKQEARKWTRLFESFMLTYIGYFKQKGVQEIVFCEEGSPSVSSKYRQDLPHRQIRYLVRIQRTQVLRSIRLDDIDVVAQIPPQVPNRPGALEVFSTKGEEFLSLYDKTK